MVISHSTHPVTALQGNLKLGDSQFDGSERNVACLRVAYVTETSRHVLLSVLQSGGCDYTLAHFCCSHDLQDSL